MLFSSYCLALPEDVHSGLSWRYLRRVSRFCAWRVAANTNNNSTLPNHVLTFMRERRSAAYSWFLSWALAVFSPLNDSEYDLTPSKRDSAMRWRYSGVFRSFSSWGLLM